MSHVDDGQLNALLDGELPPDAARAVEAHVATCAECARRLDEARAFLAGAGELLALLTPPALAAHPLPESLPAPLSQPGPAAPAPLAPPSTSRVAKTSKEIAVSLDGRTAVTPAIRPVFPHEVPDVKAKRQWRVPDLEKLAWAASLILCLGVGYLANEVYHLRARADSAGGLDIAERSTPDTARQVAAVPQPMDRASQGAPAISAEPDAGRMRSASGPARSQPQAPAERRRAAATPPKPPISKPPPAVTQRRPEEIASSLGASGRDASGQLAGAGVAAPTQAAPPGARQEAPQPAAPLAAQPAAPANTRELADRTRSGAAPAAARPAVGDAMRRADTTGRLDERSGARAQDALAATTPTVPAFRRVPMEDAVRRLSGSIRLIDGMNPQRVDIGPGSLVPGADPERDVIRVTYSAGNRRVVLDQQLGDTRSGSAFNGLLQGDTLVTTAPNGSTQVRWIDRKFWLSLTGSWDADSVRSLVDRIR